MEMPTSPPSCHTSLAHVGTWWVSSLLAWSSGWVLGWGLGSSTASDENPRSTRRTTELQAQAKTEPWWAVGSGKIPEKCVSFPSHCELYDLFTVYESGSDGVQEPSNVKIYVTKASQASQVAQQ